MNWLKVCACFLCLVQIGAIAMALNGSDFAEQAMTLWLVFIIAFALASGCLGTMRHGHVRTMPVYVARRLSQQRFKQMMTHEGSGREGLVFYCVTSGPIAVEPEDGDMRDGETLSAEEADRCLRPMWCYASPDLISGARQLLGLEPENLAADAQDAVWG